MSCINQIDKSLRAKRAWLVRCAPRRSGFTLIEILVVVLITGLLAAAASLTLFTRTQSTTLDDIARRITFLDATARHTARRSGHVERIVIDLDKEQILCQELPVDAAEDIRLDATGWTQHIQLPRGFQLDHAWMISQAEDISSDTPTRQETLIAPDSLGQSRGQLILACSADGYTPSYAVSVTGPRSQRRWIVVLGLTGQALIAEDDHQVRTLLSLKAGQPLSDEVAKIPEQADGR